MECSPGSAGLPSTRLIGRPADADAEPTPEPMSVATVLHDPEVVAYGRHAAPPSAYGPSDAHRLLPVAPPGYRPARIDAEDAPVAVPVRAVGELVAAGDDGDGGRSAGEEPTRTTGFWARLRLAPKAA
ncbi:hypothetical protein [Blastococcus sp. SYSU DS0539]